MKRSIIMILIAAALMTACNGDDSGDTAQPSPSAGTEGVWDSSIWDSNTWGP